MVPNIGGAMGEIKYMLHLNCRYFPFQLHKRPCPNFFLLWVQHVFLSFMFGRVLPLTRQRWFKFSLYLLIYYMINGDPCMILPWVIPQIRRYYPCLPWKFLHILLTLIIILWVSIVLPCTTILKSKGSRSATFLRYRSCLYQNIYSWFWSYALILCSCNALLSSIYTSLPRIHIYGQN